jgi:hypothetical protein
MRRNCVWQLFPRRLYGKKVPVIGLLALFVDRKSILGLDLR